MMTPFFQSATFCYGYAGGKVSCSPFFDDVVTMLLQCHSKTRTVIAFLCWYMHYGANCTESFHLFDEPYSLRYSWTMDKGKNILFECTLRRIGCPEYRFVEPHCSIGGNSEDMSKTSTAVWNCRHCCFGSYSIMYYWITKCILHFGSTSPAATRESCDARWCTHHRTGELCFFSTNYS